MLIGKRFDDISGQDIMDLISDGVAESQYIEYKREPWEESSAKRKESLYDITAFANAYGGHIIIGMRTEGDIPVQVMPLANAAGLQSDLQKRAIAGVDPRIPGLGIRPVTTPQGDVLLIHVPRTGRNPHMVTLEGTNKFYRRHGKDKLLMSVDEIGDAFLLTGRRVEHGLDFIAGHQRGMSAATGIFTSLCLGTLPLLHYPRPIDATEAWASELLASPPRPTGEPRYVDRGIPFVSEVSSLDEIVPTLDGLVRRRRNAEHLFRFALGKKWNAQPTHDRHPRAGSGRAS